MASTAEQETTINVPADKKYPVMIWTNVRREITAFRKKIEPEWIFQSGQDEDGTEWLDLRIPQDRWRVGGGIKAPKKQLTDEERQLIAERFAKHRQ